MKTKLHFFKHCSILISLLTMFAFSSSNAQLTNYQQVTKKCYSGPTQSMGNTTGTLVGNVGFSAADIPVGHKIVDVIVEIVWSKTDDGSCTAPTGFPADLSHVGFIIQAPFGPTRYIAASAGTGPFLTPSTSSSFTGVANIVQDTIVFRDKGSSLLPAGLPVAGRDTVRPNNSALSFYCGQNPHGAWRVGGIDDAPSLGPQLCIHSYCITLVTCEVDQLKASCKTNPIVSVGVSGTHAFEFPDLDSISDVSCIVKTITFSPATINCSDIGSTIPVQMTIRDHLDSVDACVSMVSVVDAVAPTISNCFPSVWGNIYLNSDGRDTFWADSVHVVDNCPPVIKEVRPFTGGAWQPFVVLNCVTGFQQFSAQATDLSGNTHSCNIVVNVIDTFAPTAVCGRDTAYLTTNPNGAVTVSAVDLDGGSFDACPPIIGRWVGAQFAPPPVYTCADLGVDTVRLIVSDVSGNLDSCENAVVVIVDTLPPVASCFNDTIYLNSSGVAIASAANIDNGSMDVCGIASIDINGLASVSFDCSHVNAPQLGRLRIFDTSGNADSCIGWITVKDTFPPVANCKAVSLYIDGTGSVTIPADSLNNNSVDLCTGNNLTFEVNGSPTVTFDCSTLTTNPNITTLTVIDSFGNRSTCSASVTVWDTITPSATCTNPTIYLNNSGIATLFASELSAGSWDNCIVTDSFVNINGNGFATFNCTSIFTPQSATLIVQDAQGNASTCNGTVNVLDTVAPVALCEGAFTTQLNAAGIATVIPVNIDSNSTDNCGLVQYLINNSDTVTYTCADVGTQVATLTVRDSSGNTASCPTQIIIQDNTTPIVSCQTTTVYLNQSGVVSVTPNDVLIYPATSDNCGIATTSFSIGNSINYNCDSVGMRTVQVMVTDNFGNVSSCMTTITVVDTIPPIASCRPVPYTVQLDSFGVGCVTPVDIDNGSSDLCNLDTMLVNGVDSFCFNCSSLGNNVVTLTLLDSSGNQSSCLASVLVTDVVNPIALCHDTTLYLGATGVVTIFPADIDAGSSDNCSFSRSINGLASISYTCNQIGGNSVQLEITDNSGNVSQCPANITILDTIVPIANCIASGNLNVYLDSSCFASIPASVLNNGSTDNCNLSSGAYTVGGLPNATFTAGNLSNNPNNITLTVTDLSGNFSTCNTTVTVLDTIRPIITCTSDTVQLDISGNVVVLPTVVLGSVIDNCTNSFSYMINGQSSINFDCTNLGLNAVSLTAADSSGNTSTCSGSIWVEDNIAPNANCSPTQVLNLNSGGTFGVLTTGMIDLGSSDNCSIVSRALSQDTFTCSDINTNPHAVTLWVTDGSGNVDSCTSQITVVDNTSPTVSCQTATVYLGSGSVNVTPAAVLVPPTGDNCTALTSTFAGLGNSITYTCDSIGVNSVTVVVIDISGNTASCITSITVLDTVSPTASCSSIPYTVQLDTFGVGFVTPQAINAGSFDFCGIDTMLVNGIDTLFYSCANIGASAVTLSVLDSSGNQSNCTANIVVNDPINPIALCHDTTLYLGSTGVTIITPNLIDAGSSDNCGFTATVNGSSSVNFDCSQVGTNTVQLIITDNSGNVSQCPANVTILDTLSPIANCIGPGMLTVYLDNTCFASIPASALNNGSTDNCNLSSGAYTVGGLPNATFTAGNLSNNPNNITLTVTDLSGNFSTCNTTVTVLDTIRPIITCTSDTVQLDISGNVTVLPTVVLGSAIDNCTNSLIYTMNGQSSINFDCTNLGLNAVSLTAADSSGNTSICSGTIWVEDNIAPHASCRPTQVLNLNSGGTFGVLTTGMIDLGSSDNCSIVSRALSQDTFTCNDIYTNPHAVTLWVTDGSGNVDSCTSQITVEDNTSPTVSCQTATVYLGSGSVNVTPATVLVPPTGDNCTALTSTFAGLGNNIIYTCDSIGVHSVTVVVTDISGNTASCITSITVLDTVSPIASCSSIPYTVQLDTFGVGFVTPQDIDAGSFDFCGIDTMLINGIDTLFYSCANMGASAVTLSVLDSSGNQSNCTANIVVNDPINPIALCHDTTLYLGSTGVTIITPNLIDAGSSDNCGFTATVNGSSSVNFDCSQVGTNTVQLIITDNSGNTTQCASNVTILDTLSPIANCIGPGILTVYLDNTCFASIPASALNNGSTDNCSGALSFLVGGLPNATFNATNLSNNPNPITLVVRDATGNVSTCTTTIIVTDTIKPIVSCQPDTIQLIGSSTVVSPLMINAGATDNCSVPTLTINGQPSLTLNCNHLGANVVTLIGTDISGNVDSCSTIVYLEDIAKPVANCNLVTTVYIDPTTNLATLQPIDVDNGSTDNCTIVNYGLSQDTFDCNDLVLNPHAIFMYVEDQSGNRDSCITQVVIRDTISPVAICKNDTLYFSGLPIIISANSVDGGSSDNCALQSFSLSQDSFNCPDIGVNFITLTVTDSSNNMGTCIAEITVLDTTASAIAGASQLLCITDSTSLAAVPASGSLLGTWTTSSGALIDDPNAPNTAITNIPAGLNVFYWTLSNATCSNLSMDSVVINYIPPSLDVANAGLDQNLCQDTIVNLSASPIYTSSGQWLQSTAQANAGTVILNPTDSQTVVTGVLPGNSYLFVWELTNSLCGVHMTDTIVINIDETPTDQANAGSNVTCSPDSLNLSATPSIMGIGHWSTPTTATIADSMSPTTLVSNFAQDTTMMIWSLSNGFCFNYSSDTMYVILDDVWPRATMDSFNLVPDGSIATIDVILNDTLPFNWDIFIRQPMVDGQMTSLGNGQFRVDINNAVLNQYFVYEICNTDCPIVCDTALVAIGIQPPGDCYTPTAFTPNGDGSNDFFVIPCLGNTAEKAALYIFNRWGNLVFETDNYESDWDGTHRNQPLPDGVYFYILQIEGKTPQNGSIEIKR